MESDFQRDYHAQEASHWWSVGRRDAIVRLLRSTQIPRAARVLDVGCSSGRLVAELRGHGWDARGVDVSAEAVEAAARLGLEDFVSVAPADIPDVPEESVDVVVASDVLEHIEDDVAALRAWRRALVPGGRLVVFVPAHPLLWSHHDAINHHHRRYTRRALRSAVETAGGLKIERTSGWNVSLLGPVAAVRALDRVRTPPNSHAFVAPHPLANRALLALIRGENRLLEAVNLPSGVSLMLTARRTT